MARGQTILKTNITHNSDSCGLNPGAPGGQDQFQHLFKHVRVNEKIGDEQ